MKKFLQSLLKITWNSFKIKKNFECSSQNDLWDLLGLENEPHAAETKSKGLIIPKKNFCFYKQCPEDLPKLAIFGDFG